MAIQDKPGLAPAAPDRLKGRELEPLTSYLAWLSRLGLGEEQAAQANRERDTLLTDLSASCIGTAFKGTKPYYGRLSPGCWCCGQGSWSCLFLNRLCTAKCFFCPQDRSQKEERLPRAEEIPFAGREPYVEYLRRFGLQGVGISGGETFLAFDKLLAFLNAIREGLGPDLYLWLYTNGDLVDLFRLEALRQAGLDEIRLNISARRYDLGPVALARSLINTVTVEIPVLPEDHAVVQQCMLDMDRLGVDYLNLHQLVATQHNYERLARRGYTFLPPLAFHESPVLESEMAALRLIQVAAERDLALAVHYCSHAYKARFQTLARRRRGALQASTAFERITQAGYIRRWSVEDAPDQVNQLVSCFLQAGLDPEMWAVDGSGHELHFDPTLRPYISFKERNLIVRYFEAHVVSHGYLSARGLAPLAEVELAPGQRVLVGKKLVAHRELSDLQFPAYAQLVWQGNCIAGQSDSQLLPPGAAVPPRAVPSPYRSAGAAQALVDLIPLEHLSQGFPAIPTTGKRIR